MLLIGYIALIYSTLQFMPTVNSFFSSLMGRYFGLVANIVVGTVVFMVFSIIFKRNPGHKSLLFYISIIAVFASYVALLFLATPIVAEKIHLLEYGFLSYLALRAVKGSQSHIVIAGKIGTVPEAKGSLWGLSHFSPKPFGKSSGLRPEQGRRTKQSLYVVVIITIVGSLDELIQGFTPDRYYELRDVILNIVSGVLGLFVLKLYEKPKLY